MSQPPDIKALWRAAPEEIPTPDFEAIRKAAHRFQRRKALGNAIEYAAAAVVIVMFGWYLHVMPGLFVRLGLGLGIIWALFYIWQRRRLITTRPVPEDAAACIDFHRRELERQRDVVRGAWRWTLAPSAVVIGLMLLGRWFEVQPPGTPAWRLTLMVGMSLLYAATSLTLFALWFQHRADKLQDQIDELDRIGSPRP
jgi:hypothetical protein